MQGKVGSNQEIGLKKQKKQTNDSNDVPSLLLVDPFVLLRRAGCSTMIFTMAGSRSFGWLGHERYETFWSVLESEKML